MDGQSVHVRSLRGAAPPAATYDESAAHSMERTSSSWPAYVRCRTNGAKSTSRVGVRHNCT